MNSGEPLKFQLSSGRALPAKQKIVVGRSMAIEEDYEGASRVILEYLKAYPGDYLGYRILGGASYAVGERQRALYAYTNAVMLGDEECYAPLGFEALELGRLDLVRDIVPHLLVLKRASRTDKDTKLEIVVVLAVYSERTGDKALFEKALLGVDPNELISRQDICQRIGRVCKELGMDSSSEACRKIAVANNSGKVATNSISTNLPPASLTTNSTSRLNPTR